MALATELAAVLLSSNVDYGERTVARHVALRLARRVASAEEGVSGRNDTGATHGKRVVAARAEGNGPCSTRRHMSNLLLVIIVLFLLFGWGGGMSLNVGGGLVHLLLVIAVIVVLVRVISGRRAI